MPNMYTGHSDGDLPLLRATRTPAKAQGPESSQEAARHVESTGKLNAQMEEALLALDAYVDEWGKAPTSHELAGGDLALRYMYGRRLPDLRAIEPLPLVRRMESGQRCAVTNRKAFRWEPTEEGKRQATEIRRRRR